MEESRRGTVSCSLRRRPPRRPGTTKRVTVRMITADIERRCRLIFAFFSSNISCMPEALPPAPEAALRHIPEIVPAEIPAPPMPHERRWLVRDECALVLDRLLRRLARQEARCRRVLGRIA